MAKATGGSIVMTLADMDGNETFDPANLGAWVLACEGGLLLRSRLAPIGRVWSGQVAGCARGCKLQTCRTAGLPAGMACNATYM